MTEAERLTAVIRDGKVKEVRRCIQALLDLGYDQERIVQECMMPALETVGYQFERQEIYIPQMLMAARAVNEGNAFLKRKQTLPQPWSRYKVVIGTVKDDLHFIGKNLVAMSMRAMGIDVIDLGVDVPPELFVQAAESDEDVAIVAVSCLLTTTMSAMRKTVKTLKACKAADRIQIMVGGGPISPDFAAKIGADIYTRSAYDAAMSAKAALEQRTAASTSEAETSEKR